MIPIAVPFPIRVVLVQYEPLGSAGLSESLETIGHNTLARSLIGEKLSRIRALWGGIFRMGAVDVKTPSIEE